MSGHETGESATQEGPSKRGARRAAQVAIIILVAAMGAAGAFAALQLTKGNDSTPKARAQATGKTPAAAISASASGNGTTAATTAAKATTVKTVSQIGPIGLTAKGLRRIAGAVGQPIYWVGPRKALLELTRTTSGTVYVRYLPRHGTVGSKKTNYLIIATYVYPNALVALENAAGRKVALRGGGLAVVDTKQPRSVHLAFPGGNVQVEIFDPSPSHALSVAQSGAVRPVSATAPKAKPSKTAKP